MISCLLDARMAANKLFFSNKIHFISNFVAFSPSGVSISLNGVSYLPVSTFASLRQSSWILRSDRTSSSLRFSSAKFKIAVSLSVQLQRNAWQILAAVSSGGTSLVTAPFSSCWRAELQRLARTDGTSVTGSNPCHRHIPCRTQKHKFKFNFKIAEGDAVYNL